MIELNETQQKEIVNLIVDCYRYSKDRFGELYTLFGYLESLYNLNIPDEMEQDLEEENPGLVPADMHVGADELLAEFDNILFANDPFFSCKGGENTSERKLRNITSYLKTTTYKSKLKKAFRPTLKSAIHFGAGIGYVDTIDIPLNVLRKDLRLNETSQLRYRDIVSEKSFTCPIYIGCDIRRFFPDPDNIQRKWGIIQSKSSLLDVLEDAEEEKDRRQYEIDIDALRKSTFPQADFEEFNNTTDFRSNLMKGYNLPVELLHFRGWIPIPNEDPNETPKFMDVIATVANRELLIQFDKNEWHYPAAEGFIQTTIFPEDYEIAYPVSKMNVSKNALLQKFYIRNRLLMALARNLNPPMVTDDPSKDFPDYIQAQSGEVIKLTRGAKLEPLKTGEVPNEAYLESNNLTNEMQYIFGSNQFSAGATTPQNKLATGIMVLKGVTDSVKKFESNVIVDTGLIEILTRYYDIGRLTIEKIPIQMYDSNEVVELGMDDIDGGDIDIQIELNDVWNHPIQRQEMLKFAEIYKDDPYVDPVKLRRQHFRLIQLPNVEELVPDPAEKMLPVDKENMMMVKMGIPVPVLPQEPHELHLKGHLQFKDIPNVAQHIQQHIAMLQAKEQSPNAPGTAKPRIPMAQDEIGLAETLAQKLNYANFQR